MNLKFSSRFLLDGFLYILVFTLMIRRAKGEKTRGFNLEEYLTDYFFQDEFKDYYHPAVTESAASNNYNDYPYEKLLKFVKETKRILQSPYNDERKKILAKNFGNHYTAYLKGDNSDVACPQSVRYCPPIPAVDLVPPPPPPVPAFYNPPVINHAAFQPSGFGSAAPTNVLYRPSYTYEAPLFNNTFIGPSMGSDAPRAPPPAIEGIPFLGSAKPESPSCKQIIRLFRPQRLKSVDGKEHFILNLGNEFVQEIKVVQCSDYQAHCGDRSTWPENYEKICEQTYNSYKTLFSVPVSKEINLLDQNLHKFEVASGCHCRLKKI